MNGRVFDLLFFFAPVLLGISILVISQSLPTVGSAIWLVILLNAFGAGPFHQGPTWFFYLDKKHRAYFGGEKKKQLIFYAGPPLIMLLSIAGMLFVPAIAYLITLLWAVQHVIQQNLGILLLYQNAGRGEAVLPRPVLSSSLWMPSLFFCCLFIHRFFVTPIFVRMLDQKTLSAATYHICETVWLVSIAMLGLYALYAVGKYVWTLRKMVEQGQVLNLPAVAFWLVAVLSMAPFGFVGRSFDEAFCIPVTIHWFQYIGLNYMLVKYKYVLDSPDNLIKVPPFLLFFLTCFVFFALGMGLISLKASGVLPHDSLLYGVVFGVVVGLANVHYFLDAFIWRFREAYQRQEILPHLIRYRQERA